MSFLDRLLEKDLLPDVAIRAGIRHLLGRKLKDESRGGVEAQQKALMDFINTKGVMMGIIPYVKIVENQLVKNTLKKIKKKLKRLNLKVITRITKKILKKVEKK